MSNLVMMENSGGGGIFCKEEIKKENLEGQNGPRVTCCSGLLCTLTSQWQKRVGRGKGIGGLQQLSVVLRLVPLCPSIKSICGRGLLVGRHAICGIFVCVGCIRHAGLLAWICVVLGEEC